MRWSTRFPCVLPICLAVACDVSIVTPDVGDAPVDDAASERDAGGGGGDPAVDAGSDDVVFVDAGSGGGEGDDPAVDAGNDVGGDPVVDAGSGGGDPVVDAGSGGGDPVVDAGSPPPPPPPPRGPAELLVLTANVENLPRTSDALCPGDFRDLYSYLQSQGLRPDVFFVQQLSGQAQLDELLALLNTRLGRAYAGRVAEADPTPFSSPCGAQKERQTNAVIFATDRLQLVGEPVVQQSYKNVGGSCVLNTQSRSRTIALLLRDLVTGEDVSATALHWSTADGGGPDPACATANARELDQIVRVHHGGASLFIAGGDTNEPDLVTHDTTSAFRPWYATLNVDLGGALGWLDPIWRQCQGTGNLRGCLVNQWSFRAALDKRIDFVFSRRAPGALPESLQAHTITFNEAGAADLALSGSDSDLPYSDHRAVWARLRY